MILHKPISRFSNFLRVTLVLGMLPWSAAWSASSYSVPLAWNGPPEEIQGFRIYVGTASGQYSQSFDTGAALAFSIPNMQFESTYYITVTAIGGTGLESLPSNELVVKITPPPLPTGVVISKKAFGLTGLDWTIPKSTVTSHPTFLVEESMDLKLWTQVDTVEVADATGSDSQSLKFSWPVTISGLRKFYRLTSRNWIGVATGP